MSKDPDWTNDQLEAALDELITEMGGAPREFWIREHRAVVYHAIRLKRALRRLEESGYSGTLVDPIEIPER